MVLLNNLQLDTLYGDVRLKASVYSDNGNTVLKAADIYTNTVTTTLTVNTRELPLYILNIKDTDEYDGVFDWLVDNRIIEPEPDYDMKTGAFTARGAMLVNAELQQQTHEAYQRWAQENATTLHFLDNNDEPLLEDDGTPVTIDLKPDAMRTLERMAAQRNVMVEDLILKVVDEKALKGHYKESKGE